MNTINRILVVIGIVVAMVVCAALFVAPIALLSAVSEGLQRVVASLQGTRMAVRLVLGILFALAWVFVCIILLLVEIVPRQRKTVRVQKIDGGEVEVSLRTVEEHVAYEVDRMRGVLRTRSRVTAHRDGVGVEVHVDMAGDEAVPVHASRVVETVRNVIENKVGVKLARPPKVYLRAQPAPVVVQRPVQPRPAIPAEEEGGESSDAE